MIWGDEDDNDENKSEENEEKEQNEEENEKKKKDKEEEKPTKTKSEDEDSESDSRKIRSPKEKVMDLIKDKYHSIKNAIKANNFKTVQENFDELVKNHDKINSAFKKEDIPAYYYECFALVEDITNISKEEQKKLPKENSNSINSLRKVQVRILKKIGPAFAEYKKNRKSEEDLEKDFANIEKKQAKKIHDESDDDDDILELIKRDEDKTPEQRRLKWVKKEKIEEKQQKKDQKKIHKNPKNLKKMKTQKKKKWKLFQKQI